MGLGGFFTAPNNTRNGNIVNLYIQTGNIQSVDLVNGTASVLSTVGLINDVRIPLTFYSSSGQIVGPVAPGDFVTLAADSQNNYFILGFYSQDPENDQNAFKLKLTPNCLRMSNGDISEILLSKDILLSCINGNMLSLNSNTLAPAISFNTPGKINLVVNSGTDNSRTITVEPEGDGADTSLKISINKELIITIDKDNNIDVEAPGKVTLNSKGDVSISSQGKITTSSTGDTSIGSSGYINLGDARNPVVTTDVLKQALTLLASTAASASGLLTTAEAANGLIDALTAVSKVKA